MKKTIVIGILVLLMLVSLPTAVGDDEIEFPKEDGPYTIYVGGLYRCTIFKPIEIEEGHVQFGPLCLMKYPKLLCIYYIQIPTFKEFHVVLINGKYQGQLLKEYNGIDVYGFKGFYPADYWQTFKQFSSIITPGRIRAFGICDEINFH